MTRWILCMLVAVGGAAAVSAEEGMPVSLTLSPFHAAPARLGPIDSGATAVQSTPATIHVSQGQLSATPEMWFYEQEWRRYEDPLLAVRRKAEARSQARQDRLTSQKWFGFSNARPTASPVPTMSGTASPSWSGNHSDPYRWVGSGR